MYGADPAPYFLLSYARVDVADDPYFPRFYRDLVTEVRLRVGADQADSVGFLDVRDIPVGTDWSSELSRALARCRTFVALCTPTYFQSENCGREWGVYAERLRRAHIPGGRRPAGIIPVMWAGMSTPPTILSALQYGGEVFGETYRRHGVRYLLQLNRHSDDYQEFVIRLAEHLVRLARDSPVGEADVAEVRFELATNAFAPDSFPAEPPAGTALGTTSAPTTEPATMPLTGPVAATGGAAGPGHAAGHAADVAADVATDRPRGAPGGGWAGPASVPPPPADPGPPAAREAAAGGRWPPTPPDRARLPEAAALGGSSHVMFVLAASGVDDLPPLRKRREYYGPEPGHWQPYRPHHQTRLCVSAQMIAALQDMTSTIITPDTGPLREVLENARERNQIVVFLVDIWAVWIERIRAALAEYDTRNVPTSAVLVPSDRDDAETENSWGDLVAALWGIFRNGTFEHGHRIRTDLHTYDDFHHTLEQLLRQLQDSIIKARNVLRSPRTANPRPRPILKAP